MERTILILAAFVVACSTANAQTPKEQPADTLVSACLLQTDERAWIALGLSTEQVDQVRGLQTECKTACMALNKEAGRTGTMSPAILADYQERIKQVLGTEQYGKWLEWCNTHPAKG